MTLCELNFHTFRYLHTSCLDHRIVHLLALLGFLFEKFHINRSTEQTLEDDEGSSFGRH